MYILYIDRFPGFYDYIAVKTMFVSPFVYALLISMM